MNASEQAILNAQYNAAIENQITERMRQAPHILLRPRLMADGDMWCMLLGEDLQTGVAGFGATPSQAAEQFDRAWNNAKTPMALLKEHKK